MASLTAAPLRWSVDDVDRWASSIKLSDDTRSALKENEIDGFTLVTLSKNELKSELGISSLATRRYLWEHIEKLRYCQEASDVSIAVSLHQEEIDSLTGFQITDNEHHVDHEVLGTLRHEAEVQRQVLDDAILAYRLGGMSLGQQFVEDSELAFKEQRRIDLQAVQSEYDHIYARTLNPGSARTEMNQEVKSLMRVCIDTCADNGINVAEALEKGEIRMIDRNTTFQFDETKSTGEDEDIADEEERFLLLQEIHRCNACFEEALPGFILPCEHQNCKDCTKRLFETALRDSSLLPLTCCEIPIDMTISKALLKKHQVETLEQRVEELQANRKMFCPSCSQFINLDKVEASTSLGCKCGTMLCTICATACHPTISCEHNQAIQTGSDEPFLEMAAAEGWRQCPGCSVVVELKHGCNHITCSRCKTQFCYRCGTVWDRRTGLCSSGRCELWDEDRLVAGQEARVQAEEQARGAVFEPAERQHRLHHARRALQTHQFCDHEWRRENLTGECERCGFDLWVYGMVCDGDCGSTVCYTCAHHRIPQRGWN